MTNSTADRITSLGIVRPKGWVVPEGLEFIFGVDVDNVCADYDDAYRNETAKALGVDASTLGPVTDWDYSKISWGIRDRAHFEEIHFQGVRDGMFAKMNVIDGCREALQELSDAGIHNRIITHRLFMKGLHGQSAGDTVRWLDEAELPYRSLCMVEQKKDVHADLYVDDAPHNIRNLRNAGRSAAVFSQGYNQAIPGLRFDNWETGKELVLDLAYIKSLTRSNSSF